MADEGPRLIVELSGEEPGVALGELRSVLDQEAPGAVVVAVDRRVATIAGLRGKDPVELAYRLAERLAYAHVIDEFLGIVPAAEFPDGVARLPIPPGSICVRGIRAGAGAKATDVGPVQGSVGKALAPRAVDLDHPDVLLRVYLTKDPVVGRRLNRIDRGAFDDRRPSKRPFFSPISLMPRVARCLVNLGHVRRGSVVLDPFCGTGGILIEAGLVGCRLYGSDVSRKMVFGTRENLGAAGLTAEQLEAGDVGAVDAPPEPVDAIVTDLPYGRSSTTRKESRESLYTRAFARFAELLPAGKIVVFMVPDPGLRTLLPEGLPVVEHHALRVHRSLTRHVFVCRRA